MCLKHGKRTHMKLIPTISFAVICSFALAQEAPSPPQVAQPHIGHPPAMGICKPMSERKDEIGCWIITNHNIGKLLETQTFWHLDVYPTRAAAESAKSPKGIVIEALGKTWLMTIASADWRPSLGERMATVGPLPISQDLTYTAQYMESVFTPGMTAPPHRHPGPEAWYTVSGETCLETPEGKLVDRPGQGARVIIPSGRPMQLTATGTDTRRSIILVLHDSSKPAGVPAPDWTPKGLCKN
jgi:quercetin dioxygenase-like cupin family protein